MCDLYALTTPRGELRAPFGVADRLGNQPSRSAVFPDAETRFGWVTNVRRLDRWSWRDVLAYPMQRCLVPASSFAEYPPP